MVRLKGLFWALLVSVLAGGWSGIQAQEHMVGLDPCDGLTMFVKRFSVTAGTTITGVEFRNNDPRTVFPEVVLVRGASSALSTGATVARATNVSESAAGWVRVTWSPAVEAASAEEYYVGVRMPQGAGKLGAGNGPGVAAVSVSPPNGNFVAGGADGELTPAGVDLTMSLVTSGVAKASANEPGAVAVRMSLGGVPNPFNPSTTIEFGVEQLADVRLSIYDVAGREIRRLVQERLAPGAYRREWDGRDEHEREVAAGVYVVRFVAGETVVQKKMVLLK